MKEVWVLALFAHSVVGRWQIHFTLVVTSKNCMWVRAGGRKVNVQHSAPEPFPAICAARIQQSLSWCNLGMGVPFLSLSKPVYYLPSTIFTRVRLSPRSVSGGECVGLSCGPIPVPLRPAPVWVGLWGCPKAWMLERLPLDTIR